MAGLADQFRVFFALMMREMATRYGRTAGGYAWAIVDPAGFVAMMSLVFGQIAHEPPLGQDFALFFATGYMAFHIYMDISSNVSMSIEVNRPLFSFPRVTLLDSVIARFVLQLLTSVTATIVILGAAAALSDTQVRLDFGPIFLAVALAALLGLSVGTLNCVLFAYSKTWRQVFGVINRPLFIVSGVFFLYEGMPSELRDALWWNPLVHVVALMRAGFYPTYEAAFASPVYVVLFALGPLMLGVLLLRALKASILDA